MGRKAKSQGAKFHIVAEYEAEFRQAAESVGLTYSVHEYTLNPRVSGVLEFRFPQIADKSILDLMNSVPENAFAFRAIVGGSMDDLLKQK